MGTSKRRVSCLKAIWTWSWATCSTAWVGGLDQMTTRGLFQPQSLLFCDVRMQMDYIPWHARPGKDLQTLSRPVDLRAYRNEHLILSQRFSKHPAGKAHQELTLESLTQCRGIKWATIDSSHLHFCDSTACNKSVMPQLWLQVFWWVGVAAGDIELVSFVGKEQAYMQCGHKKSSPCPRLFLHSVFHRLRFHVWLQDWSNWLKQPPAFCLFSFFCHTSPHPFHCKSPSACASAQ